MKILFLDDDRTRHEVFRENMDCFPKQDVIYVWTAYAAIKALEKELFDHVYLDHDLAGQDGINLPDIGEGSGYDVACFIATLPKDKRPHSVTIHSWNPNGAYRMAQALSNAAAEGMKLIRAPFSVDTGLGRF